MAVLNTDTLLESIKRTFTVPTNQQLLTDDDVLQFCDEELLNTVMPEIITLRGDFFTAKKTQALTAGTNQYRIPERALGRGLRDVILRRTDGTETNLVDFTLDLKHERGSNSQGQPWGFYLYGDYIVFIPVPDAAYSIDFYYDQRPSKLSSLLRAAQITAINTVTQTLTLASNVTGMSTLTPVDLVSAKSSNITLAIDLSPISVSSLSIQFAASTLPSELAVGDYVTFAKESPFCPIPEECLPVLIQAVGNRIMLALGDMEAISSGEKKLTKLIDSMKKLLEPRMRGESVIAVNQHFVGYNRSRNIYRRG